MRTLNRIATALAVCALLSTAALAGVKTGNVNFREDVIVGDTLIEKGSYKVSYDDETKELKIIDDGKVVATATATLSDAKTVGRYKPLYTSLTAKDGSRLLTSVGMGGKYAQLSSERIAAVRSASNIQ
ncbi:MAG TPA: hypothetical protein VD968_07735 [Pyrinomonadaceae bacterium]|nr:hypothetical protein [Pyrinomonadaceae bacterium]